MPINNQSAPTTPLSANNQNSNYSNLKYTDNNYRDFQRAKSDGVNSAPVTPSVTLPMFNVFEKNKSTRLNFTNGHDSENSTVSNRETSTTAAVNNKNLTKIPLSPKSKNILTKKLKITKISYYFFSKIFFGKTFQHPLLRC